MRLRLILIVVGAIIVGATFTFPLWQPYISVIDIRTAPQEAFPGLPQALSLDYLRLPPDQQRAYLTLAETNPELAVRMLTAALQPGVPAPESDNEAPSLTSPIIAARGVFQRIDPIRWAQGAALIYVGADDRKFLRLEGFTIVNSSDLRVILSATAEPTTIQEMRRGNLEFDVGPLRGTYGNQNYELPVELELEDYASVVIFSPELDTIYSVAPLIFFT